jgi:crossover junction endodeoxyribonuclease RuvC
MVVCGIDPGLTGALAFLRDNDTITVYLMPVLRASATKREIDMTALTALLVEYKPSLVILERVHAMPKQGVASSFQFGRSLGRIEGLTAAYKTLLVTPQEWKRVVLKDTDKSKEAAVAFCRRRWPGVSLTPKGCTKPHHGLAEALCMCEFGRRLNGAR